MHRIDAILFDMYGVLIDARLALCSNSVRKTVAPGEATAFAAVTDATTVVVKLPSITGDKYAA